MPRGVYTGGGMYRRLVSRNADGEPVVVPDNPDPVTPPTGSKMPIAQRKLLTFGDYQPGPATTGHIVTPDWRIINNETTTRWTPVAGELYENCTIYGDITPPAAGPVLMRNVELLGGAGSPTSDTGIIAGNVNGGALRGGKITVEDGTVRAWRPRNGRNGFIGRQWTAIRCDVSYTTDPFGPYSTLGANTEADVEAYGCWGHDCLYSYPDPATSSHPDGAHCDTWQHQGGHKVLCLGCFFEGTAVAQEGTGTNPWKPWLISAQYGTNWANGSPFTIQNNTGAGIGKSCIYDKNWTKGGLAHYNLFRNITPIIRNGKVYRDTARKPAGATGDGHGGYWVRGRTGWTTVNYEGLGNTMRWVDGPYAGQLLSDVSNDRGIVFDIP